jgi:hypothetical protein
MKTTKPAYLNPPCGKSRASLITWLDSFQGRRWHHEGAFRFCWNVKAYHTDLSFDNLVKRHREAGNSLDVSERWMNEARELYGENEGNLWEWGCEDACSTFVGKCRDDAYRMLWNGKSVRTEFQFCGRSGGWLCLESFEGIRLDAEIDLSELEYRTLRDLAEIVQFVSHTTEGTKPEQAIETAAAWTFFVNICESEITSDEDLAKEAAESQDAACRDIATII